VIFLIEGEEEIGSVIWLFLKAHRDELSAMSSLSLIQHDGPDQPAFTYGCVGLPVWK